jgi:hypothetical protein
MTAYYAFLFLIPVVIWIGITKTFLHMNITWGEVAIQFVATSLIIFLVFLAGIGSQTSDVKFVNGVVTELVKERKSCNQYWSDWPDSFCTNQQTRTVRNGQTCTTVNNKRTCTPKYKTQYRSKYSWEQKYFIETTIDTYQISRVDAQGVNIPPRVAEANVGDPVSGQVSYTNYIRGASTSLFNKHLKPEELPSISYPAIYDFYRSDRVITVDYSMPETMKAEWNKKLSILNSDIVKTGANVIIVVTSKNQDFAEQLAQSWDAHNINDVIVVIGMADNNISWVDVRSWSEDSIVNVKIRDAIYDAKVLDIDTINTYIGNVIRSDYKLQSMDDFEYLSNDIVPPTWAFVLALIVLLIVTPAITYVMNKYKIV